MRIFLNLISIFIIFYFFCCRAPMPVIQKQEEYTFLRRTIKDTTPGDNYGAHIEIKQILPHVSGFIPMSIDDREIIGRSKYTRQDKIKILGEYLTFRGDTVLSNKTYQLRAAFYLEHPTGVMNFTVEMEALYSFTRMLTKGLPPIKPILINCNTGETLNANAKAIGDVYNIYTEWYEQNKKNDFKNIKPPLSGSPYCWLGEEKGVLYTKDL